VAWIELHQAVTTHRKTYDLADALGVSRVQAVGHLALLWCWALDNAPDGRLGEVRPGVLARACDFQGNPGDFVEALLASGFLERHDDGLHLHDWMDYAGRLVDKRRANTDRMRRARTPHVQRTDPACAEHVPDMCDARAAHVQRTCSAHAAHVPDMCDARAAHVQSTCDACAGATVPNPTVPLPLTPPLPPPSPPGGVGDAVTGQRTRRGATRDSRPEYTPQYLAAFEAYPRQRGCRDGKAGASVSFAGLVREERYDPEELRRCAERYALAMADPDARPVGVDRFYSRLATHGGKSGRIFEQYLDSAGAEEQRSTIRTKGGKYDKHVLTPEQAYERRLGRKWDSGDTGGAAGAAPAVSDAGGDCDAPGGVSVAKLGAAVSELPPLSGSPGSADFGVAGLRHAARSRDGSLLDGAVFPGRAG